MAGIYIHVPFCGSRCVYCDFYSTTHGPEWHEAYVNAVCAELSAPLPVSAPEQQVSTVYFGGGTPSQLSPSQIGRMLKAVGQRFSVAPDAEVTMEMNPDDVDAFFGQQEYYSGFIGPGSTLQPVVNRVSLGVQSFHDDTLRLLRRRHDAAGAVRAVRRLQQLGVDNISIDLIYGLPGQNQAQWEDDLNKALALGVQHLSAYALSYEPGTDLWRMRETGTVQECAEEDAVWMYRRLCQRAREAGFQHYEISNFALPGRHSRHNSSYWTGIPYYGFGPGAHSYDGMALRWSNRPSLADYVAYWNNAHPDGEGTGLIPPRQLEQLSEDERYDEFVMCGLRTREGIALPMLQTRFGPDRLATLMASAQPYLRNGDLVVSGNHLHLTSQSLLISDAIIRDLF